MPQQGERSVRINTVVDNVTWVTNNVHGNDSNYWMTTNIIGDKIR